MIYLDNGATTAVSEAVFNEMKPFFMTDYGNPESKYYDLAVRAKAAVDLARERVARFVGCEPTEVVFTSGATESNNLAIKGTVGIRKNFGNHIMKQQQNQIP